MSYFWRAFKVNSFSAFYQGWCVALISLDAWVWNTLATLSTGANQDKLNLGNSMHARTHTCTHLPRGIKNGIIFGVNGMLLSLTESYIFWTEINHTKRQLVVQENTHSCFCDSPASSPSSSVTDSVSMEYFRGNAGSQTSKSKIFTENSVTYWLSLNVL